MLADSVIQDGVIRGDRMEIPMDVPKDMRDLIEACWAHEAGKRPLMVDVVTRLEAMLTHIPPPDLRLVHAAADGAFSFFVVCFIGVVCCVSHSVCSNMNMKHKQSLV